MNIKEKLELNNCYVEESLCDFCYDTNKEIIATKNFEGTNKYSRKVRKYQNHHMKKCLIFEVPNEGSISICGDCIDLIKEILL